MNDITTNIHDPHKSYSFSFQLKLYQDIKYYKRTNKKNNLNEVVENFILHYITNNTQDTAEKIHKGRPLTDTTVKPLDKYTPFPFSLKTSTILQIKQYKKKHTNLDKNLEEHLRLIVPVREVR